MKVLHIMIGDEKFTDEVVALYNEEFDHQEHEICYLLKGKRCNCIRSDISIPQYEIILENNFRSKIQCCRKMISLMRKHDYTIIHSFCLDGLSTLYLYLHRLFCRKHIVWIEWGADLYDFKPGNKVSLSESIAFHIKKSVRSNVNSVICIFPPDRVYYKEHFPKSKSRVFYAPYIGNRQNQKKYEYNLMFSRLKDTMSRKEPVYIQIGHNAQMQLNHLKALEILSKFKNENIKLVLPLSYSVEPQYVDQIYQYLEKVFPGKYIVLKDFLPKEEYFEIVKRIDIAIFYTYRQTALSNIYRMINSNVKLFMPENSVMKEYFCSLGIPIFSVESINDMDFTDFTNTIKWEDLLGPQLFIENLNDYDKNLKYWIQIYDDLRKIK